MRNETPPEFRREMYVSPAPYLPFLDAHKGKPPGLWALDPATWVELDAAYAPQMAYRDRLNGERADQVALATPGSEAAVAELSDHLVDHLTTDPASGFLRIGEGVRRPDGVTIITTGAIGALGRLCQEDWVVMQERDGASEYVLTAANLCFPSHWDLREKIGLPLTPIHAPVPDYEVDLAPRINRVFSALHEDRPLQRLNWSVYDYDELHLPGAPHRATGRDARPDFFLRVERQTLRRLPQTKAVVFGIKIYVTPLEDLPKDVLGPLAEALLAQPRSLVEYKGGEALLSGSVDRINELRA